MNPVPTIALAGVHGYGHSYLARLGPRIAAGTFRWAGVADPRLEVGALPEGLPADVPRYGDLADLLAEQRPDVVAIATPLHTHADLAERALRSGADVVLEKPAVTGLTEFAHLLDLAQAEGRSVQVGFQSLGSAALDHVRTRVAEGRIGEVTGFSAAGCWVRARSYFTRAPWAGRRRLGDQVVADGVLTNPLAHAVATALAVAGRQSLEDVLAVEVDPFRVNDIETDDTTSVVVSLRDSPDLVLAATLAAAEPGEPFVVVEGTRGRLTLYYTLDVVVEELPGRPPATTQHTRVDLLDDLLRHREDGRPLRSPLASAGAFTRVLDAIVNGPRPRVVRPDAFRVVELPDGDERRELPGVEEAVHEALRRRSTFSGCGVDWT